jgi:4-hydroxyphenylacetate 3-monooxygenase
MMLKTGSEYLAQLRDGRAVYVGSERIDDVTSHPAFKNAAHSIAELYDLKASPDHRDAMSFEEGGHSYSAYFLQPKTKADLSRRNESHYRIADYSYGLLGRSPDHVASFVTGMSLRPEVFGRYADNIAGYYRHMRDNDIFAATPCCRRRQPAILSSFSVEACLFQRCALFARPSGVSSYPA